MRTDFKSLLTTATFVAAATVGLSSAASAQAGFKDSANVTMFGADAAFTLPHGDMYFGASLADPRGGVEGGDLDGSLSFGAGFGNPIDAIGLQFDVNVTGTDPLGDAGSFTLKASRALMLKPNHVIFGSVAASNLGAWGGASGSDERWNATVSGLTQVEGANLIHPVMWTVGYGSDSVLSTAGSSLTEDGFFGGVGVGVTKYVGIAASATENQLNLGLGVKLPGVEGVSLSYGIYDITDNMDRKQQMFSVSYSLPNVFGGR